MRTLTWGLPPRHLRRCCSCVVSLGRVVDRRRAGVTLLSARDASRRIDAAEIALRRVDVCPDEQAFNISRVCPSVQPTDRRFLRLPQRSRSTSRALFHHCASSPPPPSFVFDFILSVMEPPAIWLLNFSFQQSVDDCCYVTGQLSSCLSLVVIVSPPFFLDFFFCLKWRVNTEIQGKAQAHVLD